MPSLPFENPIRASLLQFTDDVAIRLRVDVAQWIAGECAGTAQLRYNGSAFIIGFDDKTDATLFHIQFA